MFEKAVLSCLFTGCAILTSSEVAFPSWGPGSETTSSAPYHLHASARQNDIVAQATVPLDSRYSTPGDIRRPLPPDKPDPKRPPGGAAAVDPPKDAPATAEVSPPRSSTGTESEQSPFRPEREQ